MTTIKGKNLDVNLVTLADKTHGSLNGSKFVWAGYKGQKLAVQTPRMNVAFNMKPNTMGEYPKYSVELSFKVWIRMIVFRSSMIILKQWITL